MTLAISTLISSGIVLTADSRQTYRNQAGVTRIGSDTVMKIFKLSSSCGVAISGRAFLNEDGQPAKDVSYFINRFAESENLSGLKTKEIAEKLNKSLGDIFVAREIEALKKQVEEEVRKLGGTELKLSAPQGHLLPYSYKGKDGNIVTTTGWIDTVNMIVAGVDDDKVGRAYSVLVPRGIINERDTIRCGALWVGQTDVLVRIVKGYAPEIEHVAFVKDALSKNSAGVSAQLDRLEYIINWARITLQDAIDFCVLATRTTENIQRFSDGTFLAPSGITGVGGEIDVAVITPEKGFTWLKKKRLRAEGAELSLDKA